MGWTCPASPSSPSTTSAAGVPTVLPAVDFKAPGSVNPDFVFAQVARWGVTRMSGAPAYIERLVSDLEARQATETRVRQLGVGGAPTPISLCARVARVFPQTEAQVIYGSTEAEPIASVDMGEILASEAQAPTLGHLVGQVAHAANVALVDLPEPPPALDERGMDRYRASLRANLESSASAALTSTAPTSITPRRTVRTNSTPRWRGLAPDRGRRERRRGGGSGFGVAPGPGEAPGAWDPPAARRRRPSAP